METFHLLLLEDKPFDTALINRALQRSGMLYTITNVENEQDFITALTSEKFDAILADNSLPQFNAIEALKIYNKFQADIPFILVTGSVSEEFAVETLKEGACDYILKDRLQRLPNAVFNSIKKCRADRERKKYLDEIMANESLLKQAEQIAHYGSWEVDLTTDSHRWSDEQYRIQGYEPGEIKPSFENFMKRIHPDDLQHIKSRIDETVKNKSNDAFEFRLVGGDGVIKYISAGMLVKRTEGGIPFRLNGFIRDVSEIKLAALLQHQITADLLQRNKDLEQFSYIVSHNLRAPVANIVGIANILADCNLSEQEREEFMAGLGTSVNKLDNVIKDLTAILQVKKEVNEQKEVIFFSRIVKDIKTGLDIKPEDKAVLIRSDFHEIDKVSSLKSYIHSIFYNLITNSVKFAKPEQTPLIEIKSSRNNGFIMISFKDNGIGIDLEKVGKTIFGLYKRFHKGYAEGRGMGLFMVKTQVETLGGKISVDSTVNVGTEFKIEFEEKHLVI